MRNLPPGFLLTHSHNQLACLKLIQCSFTPSDAGAKAGHASYFCVLFRYTSLPPSLPTPHPAGNNCVPETLMQTPREVIGPALKRAITTVLRGYIRSASSVKVFTFTKLLRFFQEVAIVTADGKGCRARARHGGGGQSGSL